MAASATCVLNLNEDLLAGKYPCLSVAKDLIFSRFTVMADDDERRWRWRLGSLIFKAIHGLSSPHRAAGKSRQQSVLADLPFPLVPHLGG
jgi:hypothetical protein